MTRLQIRLLTKIPFGWINEDFPTFSDLECIAKAVI